DLGVRIGTERMAQVTELPSDVFRVVRLSVVDDGNGRPGRREDHKRLLTRPAARNVEPRVPQPGVRLDPQSGAVGAASAQRSVHARERLSLSGEVALVRYPPSNPRHRISSPSAN